jgi:hypothetical protein
MAVGAHRDLSDLLMSWLVYTPWNAARWLGDASDSMAGAKQLQNVRFIIQSYLDLVQRQRLWFPCSMLVVQFGSVYGQLRFDIPASSILIQHNMYCHKNLELDQCLPNPAKSTITSMRQ